MRNFPQRLSPQSPIGSLFKRAFGPATRLRLADANAREPVYLALVRQLPCLKCAMEPCGEAAHVRLTSAAFHKRGGMAKKPADRWAAPLCGGCHREDRDALHRVGEYLFWQELGINPLLVCEKLYAARADIVRMRAIALQAIAERGR
jgi:hypothetical protein